MLLRSLWLHGRSPARWVFPIWRAGETPARRARDPGATDRVRACRAAATFRRRAPPDPPEPHRRIPWSERPARHWDADRCPEEGVLGRHGRHRFGSIVAAQSPCSFGARAVRYAGALGSASKLRARLVPKPVAAAAHEVASPLETPHEQTMPRRRPYRPWAELLMRTFGLDVLACPRCEGRMRLLALITQPARIARALRALGEPTELPARSPARGPPYWKSRVLRRGADTEHAAE